MILSELNIKGLDASIIQRNQKNLILSYTEISEIVGAILLSVLMFYALQLVMSFRTGALAKSWKQITVGAIFLIIAQFVILGGDLGAQSLLSWSGTILRFFGVLFLVIGLRSQAITWRRKDTVLSSEAELNGSIGV